jgi:hypothetical protein
MGNHAIYDDFSFIVLLSFVPHDVQGSHTLRFANSALLRRRISLLCTDPSGGAWVVPFVLPCSPHTYPFGVKDVKRDNNQSKINQFIVLHP